MNQTRRRTSVLARFSLSILFLPLIFGAFASAQGYGAGSTYPKVQLSMHSGHIAIAEQLPPFPGVTAVLPGQPYTFEISLTDTLHHDYVIEQCVLDVPSRKMPFVTENGCLKCDEVFVKIWETVNYAQPSSIKRTLIHFFAPPDADVKFEITCRIKVYRCCGCGERSCNLSPMLTMFPHELQEASYVSGAMFHGEPVEGAFYHGSLPWWLFWVLLALFLILLLLCLLCFLCLLFTMLRKRRASKGAVTESAAQTMAPVPMARTIQSQSEDEGLTTVRTTAATRGGSEEVTAHDELPLTSSRSQMARIRTREIGDARQAFQTESSGRAYDARAYDDYYERQHAAYGNPAYERDNINLVSSYDEVQRGRREPPPPPEPIHNFTYQRRRTNEGAYNARAANEGVYNARAAYASSRRPTDSDYDDYDIERDRKTTTTTRYVEERRVRTERLPDDVSDHSSQENFKEESVQHAVYAHSIPV